MWDILFFSSSELSLALRKGHQDYVYAFPWQKPYECPRWDFESKPEAINLADDTLFIALLVRAKADAFSRAAQLARAQMNGKIPRTLDELQTGALKFAYRRLQQKKIPADDFLDVLRCCALLQPVPESFWDAMASHMREDRLAKLKKSMGVLTRFHAQDSLWIEPLFTYLSRVLWAQDQFQVISFAASQLAICYPDSVARQSLVELAQRAQGLMKAREIEQTMAGMKPWQRTGPTIKKSIRIGPKSIVAKAKDPKDAASGGGEQEK
ncbi:hypothetical protein P5704_025570 (plasmid) [Pseudomonas sp. FeN3W]|nr:hypothetical protein P5704_025570 [Pseudomonas sp. FeN3W]